MGKYDVEFVYKPFPNGPLGPLARARLQKRDQVAYMVEDHDARADLSSEVDLSNIPLYAWSLFGANVCEDDHADDDTDEMFEVSKVTNGTKMNEKRWDPKKIGKDVKYASNQIWLRKTYPQAFGRKPVFWKTVTVDEDSFDEAVGPTFQSGGGEQMESSGMILGHMTIWDYTNKEMRANRKTYHRKTYGPKGRSVKKYTTSSDSAGRHGRFTKQSEWSDRAKMQRQSKWYDLVETTPMSLFYKGDWFKELLDEDVEDGHVVIKVLRFDDYYDDLLVTNNVDRLLKDEWATEWAEFETLAQKGEPGFRESDFQFRLARLAYLRCEFERWPRVEALTKGGPMHHHAGNGAVAPGWQDYGEELAMEQEAQLHLRDMDFRDAMNDEYGDPALGQQWQKEHNEMFA